MATVIHSHLHLRALLLLWGATALLLATATSALPIGPTKFLPTPKKAKHHAAANSSSATAAVFSISKLTKSPLKVVVKPAPTQPDIVPTEPYKTNASAAITQGAIKIYKKGATVVNKASFKNLVYYGGPVMSRPVNVYFIFYGDSWTTAQKKYLQYLIVAMSGRGNLDPRLRAWWGLMGQYGVSSSIRVGGVWTQAGYPIGGDSYYLTDSALRSYLKYYVQKKVLPADNNGVFMFMTDDQVAYANNGVEYYCQTYCGYHDSFRSPGVYIKYAIQGLYCTDGCGPFGVPDPVYNCGEVMSHELAEMATDPLVGEGSLAWYNNNYGEIGDICGGVYTSDQYFVWQRIWSNKHGACL